ncbi:MAG: BamA/TamA family outer membrane protein [Parachlamydiaceae bacterium]|nr:BamA/TamA family outer membrane protein [Parachlamydiaceae bacterium]
MQTLKALVLRLHATLKGMRPSKDTERVMIKSIFFLLAISGLLFSAKAHGDLTYRVEFQGVKKAKLETALKAASQLENSSDHSAASLGVLKRRAEADVANFVKVLHNLAYYNAKVDYTIEKVEPLLVRFEINPGPVYPLVEFLLKPVPGMTFCLDEITLDDIGVTLGTPALPELIIQAEEVLLKQMAQKGFPDAIIKKREVKADQKLKEIHVTIQVDSGLKAYFGVTKVSGNTAVKIPFFQKKICWNEGNPFNVCNVDKTRKALEITGLFSSVVITHGVLDPVTCELPIEIQVIESKHRSIGGGISFTTQRGVGALAEWDHRNVQGLGERINIRASVWKDTQDARFSYVLPNFRRINEDLLLLAEVENENIEAYSERSFSISAIFDRKIRERLRISYGLMYKSIFTSRSDNDGKFHLIKAPLQFRWTTANSLLDPTSGYSLTLKSDPAIQLRGHKFVYCPMTFTGTMYYPLTEDKRFVFASKIHMGTILGPTRRAVPPSERFYSGNESTLRGYSYMTVSPLGKKRKPIGGKSICVLSLEARARVTETIGVVGFYEVGNVFESSTPKFKGNLLQSVGLGLRYHTPIGPIRFDLALPINRRRKVDAPFQAYISIGQSF